MNEILDSEDEIDRSSGVCSGGFVVACITSSLEEEEEEKKMPLERKKGRGLRELLAGKSKGSASKDASGSQLPPPPPPLVSPFAPANLRKRKKDKEVVEEGELVLPMSGFPRRCQRRPKIRLPRPRTRRLSMWSRRGILN